MLPKWYDIACIVNSIYYGVVGGVAYSITRDPMWMWLCASGTASTTYRCKRHVTPCMNMNDGLKTFGPGCSRTGAVLFALDLSIAFVAIYVVSQKLPKLISLSLASIMLMSWVLYGARLFDTSVALHTAAHYIGSFVVTLYVVAQATQ